MVYCKHFGNGLERFRWWWWLCCFCCWWSGWKDLQLVLIMIFLRHSLPAVVLYIVVVVVTERLPNHPQVDRWFDAATWSIIMVVRCICLNIHPFFAAFSDETVFNSHFICKLSNSELLSNTIPFASCLWQTLWHPPRSVACASQKQLNSHLDPYFNVSYNWISASYNIFNWEHNQSFRILWMCAHCITRPFAVYYNICNKLCLHFQWWIQRRVAMHNYGMLC